MKENSADIQGMYWSEQHGPSGGRSLATGRDKRAGGAAANWS